MLRWSAAALIFLVQGSVNAQWSPNPAVNTAITAASGSQYQHSVISDGSGGAIIAWVDGRGSSNDIYVQRVNSAGLIQWTIDGVAICTNAGDQDGVSLTGDGSGGAILTWRDFRNTNNDVYAQRINSAGAVQWTADGVPICIFTGSQTDPTIVSDGSGGAILTWEDNRVSGTDIYAQRINSSGAAQWTADGEIICAASGNQSTPKIVSDGAGGAIISWVDPRNGTTGQDIYSQRINSSGIVQWTADGVVVCNATGTQTAHSIVSDDSSGALIAWQDFRTDASGDIYSQRMFANGTVKWTANGRAICSSTNVQSVPVITRDGNKGAIISWQDLRGGSTNDIYAQLVNSNGVTQWSSNGEVVCSATDNQTVPSVVADGNGGAIITWQDRRSGTTQDVYTQLFNSGGGAEWTTDGVPTGTAANDQESPLIVTDGTNGAIVVWKDRRNDVFRDIYASRIQFDGTILPVELVHFDAQVNGGCVELLWKTSTEVNNYGFEVERSVISNQLSVNGQSIGDWSKVGFVGGHGTTYAPQNYSFTDNSIAFGKYSYRLRQIDRDGNFKYTEAIAVELLVPRELTLSQNYPNPFNPTTMIEFTVPEDGKASLEIFDALGREVATLVNGLLKGGVLHQATFDASKYSSGIYIARLQSREKMQFKKLLLVK